MGKRHIQWHKASRGLSATAELLVIPATIAVCQILWKYMRKFHICITPSLESTPWFIPSASPVMSRLTSSFTCQLISIIITLVIIHHSFTLSLQAQNLPFQQILPTLILLLSWTAFTITGLDQTYHASRFIFRSFFFSLILFVCSVWWTKLATGQLFTPHSIVS